MNNNILAVIKISHVLVYIWNFSYIKLEIYTKFDIDDYLTGIVR